MDRPRAVVGVIRGVSLPAQPGKKK